MNLDCCLCNNKTIDGKAPEHWAICIDCLNKGFYVCEADRKVFNRKAVSSNEFKIHTIQRLIIADFDLLEEVPRRFLNPHIGNQKKVCCNNCYNILYLDKCIEKLQEYHGLSIMDEVFIEKYSSKTKFNEGAQKDFRALLLKKIAELEELKEKFLKA